MFESRSEARLDFETLINNVQDAHITEVDFFDTVPKILDGLERGVLNKDDYEITYSIMGGVYDPRLGDFNRKKFC